ncbi:MAG: hypothetical protein IM583_03630 [Pseudanabaena sp. M114S2SP2A07QC]|nr:hypothetical protein [Pseudanabaena sp. M090S1SP2A07QC]MCA6506864.1 hypothetical protein [Pseudanabaena sp. M172S2SP2A07QC]MCA6524239.1 hypothetical protein [Pseudanabaena sp. M051S1SP2A07QC]MCA6527495.1 hypothetical protein [Pseudanabaena sp. M179S2SP2A07QC]MCA6533017.1 hypothetical protein [Pseudanabaena sp. M176S2SP2A07QC]MCA6538183.1 hypothetical protein [Pseudanabaena sp. M037S2SP2A07QC]MCA6555735.1 hypothetical protein [Pseudanabaena sp. M114S2SP2A07QC]MCA6561795.1 hypothetical prot
MAERSSAIFWVLNCPIYLLRCYSSNKNKKFGILWNLLASILDLRSIENLGFGKVMLC